MRIRTWLVFDKNSTRTQRQHARLFVRAAVADLQAHWENGESVARLVVAADAAVLFVRLGDGGRYSRGIARSSCTCRLGHNDWTC